MEFWKDSGIGADIKKTYRRGLLAVTFFEGKGDSPFGAVNMAGNAMEWTSSWYRAYPGNTYKDRRFGTQFKVLRGGSWRDTAKSLRVTDRQIGGIPNLYRDAIGGIRCVKSPTVLDLGNEGN
jgi:formylglycine-generating enzyme required for sulfatase activity